MSSDLILVVSSFNADPFTRHLAAAGGADELRIASAPFGQAIPALLDQRNFTPRPNMVVVWTEPQDVLPTFRRALDHESISTADLLEEVSRFAGVVASCASRTDHLLVPAWVLPEVRKDFSFLDYSDAGPAYLLALSNARLAENLRAVGAYVLDTQAWVGAAGAMPRSPQLRYMAKVPFAPAVFREAAQDVLAFRDARRGLSRKLVVVDLDDTLWGGLVGEVGWENLRLGGHDAIGEAYQDFQRALKALTRRGVVLGIASRNEEAIALEAIERHPAMVLRMDDFAGWEIGWGDKAEGIERLARRVNLGLESVVFLDDSPVERGRVREALPAVRVPEWPLSPMLYRQTLLSLPCFGSLGLTAEDRRRAESYTIRRKMPASDVGDVEEWLDGLGIRARSATLDRSSLQRAAQLLNKTNQMNLRTRRLSEGNLWDWAQEPGHIFRVFSVEDRFADAGLTAVLGLEIHDETASVVDFVLSCRILGRRVEQLLVHVAVQEARSAGASRVVFEYLETTRNQPCLRFLKESGLETADDRTFYWDTAKAYVAPRGISHLEQ